MDISRITKKDRWKPMESHFKWLMLLIVACSCVVFVPPIAASGVIIGGVNWYILSIPVFMFGVLVSLLYTMTTKGVKHG